MGLLFVLTGKSSSGKDALYRGLTGESGEPLFPVVSYTTRPMRENEQEGVQYHFVTIDEMERLEREGRVIERRTYDTRLGPWHYFTVDDGQFDTDRDLLSIGTLDSYISLRDHFGTERVYPVYIETTDRVRLERAMAREADQTVPRYDEMCRRFLADQADYSEERLGRAGIGVKVLNLRPYKDPDEFIKGEGAQALEARIEEAENPILYTIRIRSERTDM